MIPLELRLLAGIVSDDEYRAYVVMGRLPIARPGWSSRFRRVLEGGVTLVTFALVLAALLGSIVMAAASMDALPA